MKNQMDSLYRRLGVTNRCEACAAILGRREADLASRIEARLRKVLEESEASYPVEEPDWYIALGLAIDIVRDEAEARPGRPPLPSPDVLPFDGPDREPSTAD